LPCFDLNLPDDICKMHSKLKSIAERLGILEDIIITGSVAKCLAGYKDCNIVGDLDVVLINKAIDRFWGLISELLKEGFQLVYDLILKPSDIKEWKPCQNQYYAHPLALTMDCERHRRWLAGNKPDKKVNLDLIVKCDDIVKIPYNDYFVRLIEKDKYNNASVDEKQELLKHGHEEFMQHNCAREVYGKMEYSDKLGLKYLIMGDRKNERF